MTPASLMVAALVRIAAQQPGDQPMPFIVAEGKESVLLDEASQRRLGIKELLVGYRYTRVGGSIFRRVDAYWVGLANGCPHAALRRIVLNADLGGRPVEIEATYSGALQATIARGEKVETPLDVVLWPLSAAEAAIEIDRGFQLTEFSVRDAQFDTSECERDEIIPPNPAADTADAPAGSAASAPAEVETDRPEPPRDGDASAGKPDRAIEDEQGSQPSESPSALPLLAAAGGVGVAASAVGFVVSQHIWGGPILAWTSVAALGVSAATLGAGISVLWDSRGKDE